MGRNNISIKQIIEESKQVIVNPKGFFSLPGGEKDYSMPIAKALVYGLVTALFYIIWSRMHISGMGIIMGGMLGKGWFGVIWISLLRAIIGLFAGAVIMLIISAICKGSTDYYENVDVTASIMVMWPVQAAFAFIYGISAFLGSLVQIVISVYVFYIIYHALVLRLKAKEDISKSIMYLLAGLLILVMFISSIAASCSRL